jgi:hypothetical protein
MADNSLVLYGLGNLDADAVADDELSRRCQSKMTAPTLSAPTFLGLGTKQLFA